MNTELPVVLPMCLDRLEIGLWEKLIILYKGQRLKELAG